MKIQPKTLKGRYRKQMSSGLLDKIAERVEKEAKIFKCSRSFVIATALAFIWGIKDQPDYSATKNVRSFRRRKRA